MCFVAGCSNPPAARLATVSYGDYAGAAFKTHCWSREPPEDVKVEVGKYFSGLALWYTHGGRISGDKQYDLRTLYYTRATAEKGDFLHWLSEEGRIHLICPSRVVAMSASVEIGFIHEPEAEIEDGVILGTAFYFSGNNYHERYKDGEPLLYGRVHGHFVMKRNFVLAPGAVTLTAGLRLGCERMPVFVEGYLSSGMTWGFGLASEINLNKLE